MNEPVQRRPLIRLNGAVAIWLPVGMTPTQTLMPHAGLLASSA